MPISEDLVAHLIESHRTTDPTNHLLRQLTARMDLFFASGTARALTEDGTEAAGIWKSYFSRDGVPAANVRIATIDLESIFTDQVVFVKQSEVDPRAKDGSIRDKKGSAMPPVVSFHADTTRAMIKYLRRLLGEELKTLRTIAQAAADSSQTGNRKTVISLDYYSDRATDTNVLHKDTTGITLFVALHYVNPEPMLGPEYIHDKWPIKSVGENGGKLYFSPYVKSSGGDSGEDKRFHAPWTKWRGSYYWPRALLRELEEAREELVLDNTLHHVNLSPYGLVSFVDELVYHATPYNKSRTQEDLTRLFSEVKFSGNSYKILPPKLERTVSKQLDTDPSSLPGLTGGAHKRCFLRLWISVVRKSWYTELATFPCELA